MKNVEIQNRIHHSLNQLVTDFEEVSPTEAYHSFTNDFNRYLNIAYETGIAEQCYGHILMLLQKIIINEKLAPELEQVLSSFMWDLQTLLLGEQEPIEA